MIDNNKMIGFDVNYFLKNCTDLEKAYENLLSEKKQSELRLNEALNRFKEINEKYEQEKKNTLDISLSISEHTDKLIKKQKYSESYENVKKQNEDFKEKIEMLKKEKEQAKLNMEEKIKMMDIKRRRETETYEKQIRNDKNKMLELERLIAELGLDISTKDAEIKKLRSFLNELQQDNERKILEYEQQIKDLIIKNEQNNRKNKEVIKDIIKDSDNLALNNLKNKLQLLQQDYNKLEKDYINLKKSLSKTSKKTSTSTERQNYSEAKLIKFKVPTPFQLYIVHSNILKGGNKYFYVIKKEHISKNKFNIRENNDDGNIEPFKNRSLNSNIFRNKYNYIPSMDEVKEDIENFKRDHSFYFTEHSILELINIENNIIVLNIEGKFFEDINVVFAEVTKYLLNKHLGILGVHPYNIKALNIKQSET
ncbi:hypothetical protein MKS88_004089 [Plasmodium brasilianum]|uniref:Uncharacterized protein n=1 Tax=Plasmodium brasilianum TaxID=5824 RepID=A0ACB9Y3U7_PLABR|nr:hypothetical protein MKS88_004089 [Plasmodium brasilianum]